MRAFFNMTTKADNIHIIFAKLNCKSHIIRYDPKIAFIRKIWSYMLIPVQ